MIPHYIEIWSGKIHFVKRLVQNLQPHKRLYHMVERSICLKLFASGIKTPQRLHNLRARQTNASIMQLLWQGTKLTLLVYSPKVSLYKKVVWHNSLNFFMVLLGSEQPYLLQPITFFFFYIAYHLLKTSIPWIIIFLANIFRADLKIQIL